MMISDQETNIIFFSELLKNQQEFQKTYDEIVEILNSFNVKHKLLPNTQDIWARDYMPVQVDNYKFIEFRYDPDYLQGIGKKKRPIKTYSDIVCESIGLKTTKSDIILDGGNVIKTKNTVILTEKIIKENRFSYSKRGLIQKLKELLEVENIILIPWDKNEEFGHSDGMIRFIDDETVLLNGVYLNDEDFKKELIKSIEKGNLNWEWLNLKVKYPIENNWAYINFLQTKDIILIPKFKAEEDAKVFEQLKNFYPTYSLDDRIVQVDMREVVKFGGALNCISWNIKEDQNSTLNLKF